MNSYPWVDCVVSPKADGLRVLLINHNGYCYRATEKGIEQLEIPTSSIVPFVIEAEDIETTYLAYDIHSIDSMNLADKIYSERLVILQTVLDQLSPVIPIQQKQSTHIKTELSKHELK